MARFVAFRQVMSLVNAPVIFAAALIFCGVTHARAYGPQGFDTVIIDAGHGGYDRGGGPGQVIPEKPYTLDTAARLQRALRSRGFRTVMTRSDDTFVSLSERVAIANSYDNAIFVSVHYNSGSRSAAHGYETYFYRSDSYGLAARLHQAQLATLNTEDRHVRRRGFFVVRRTAIPSVLCEGGFLTNPEESRYIVNSSYRERWAQNIAAAIATQSRYGDPGGLAYQPPATSERVVASRGRTSSRGQVAVRGSSRSRHAHYSSSRRTTSSRSSSRRSSSSSSKKKSSTSSRHKRR